MVIALEDEKDKYPIPETEVHKLAAVYRYAHPYAEVPLLS
jgi:hypothetical protein